MELIWISMAFVMGLLATRVGLPSLIGYLTAGFAVYILTDYLGLKDNGKATLDQLANVGVLLLLFTVGLKLKPNKVLKADVAGTSLIHFGISALVAAPVIHFGFDIAWHMAFMLSVALTFSSTVLAAQVLGSKSELKALHGQLAIGILIVQDLVAITFMLVAGGEIPSVWSFALLALFFARPVVNKILDVSGHDEMLLLAGLFLALVVGGYGFYSVGIGHGELGALVMGVLAASHPKAGELSNKMWGLKEMFLIAFFLTIGMKGLPTADDWVFAVTMAALLPIKAALFFGLLVAFKLKARTAFLTGVTLTNYSEFGLIAAATVMPDYSVTLALAVALSFLVSAPLNRFAHPLFDKLEARLNTFERDVRHPDEEPITLGETKVLVVGLGKVGRAAYRSTAGTGVALFGIDSNPDKVHALVEDEGFNAAYGDAEHFNFWKTLDTSNLDVCILAMDCNEACMIAATGLRAGGYKRLIVANAMHHSFVAGIEAAGADKTYLTMTEAGEALAAHAVKGVNLATLRA